MLIWLPPSEGKRSFDSSHKLNLENLIFPSLNTARKKIISELQRVSSQPDAATVLKLGPKSAVESTINLDLYESSCAPAIDLYNGVLFDAIDAQSLSNTAKKRLENTVWISSALFSILRPTDLIPNHRLSMSVKLPELGPLSSWWRKVHDHQPFSRQFSEKISGNTIVDCRSGTYKSALKLQNASVIEISAAQEINGHRKTITHFAKQWRGITVRWLCEDQTLNSTPSTEQILESLSRMSTHHCAQKHSHQSISYIEIGDMTHNKAGGNTTKVTLITN